MFSFEIELDLPGLLKNKNQTSICFPIGNQHKQDNEYRI